MKSTKNQDLGFVRGRIRGGFIAMIGAYKFVTTEHSGMVQIILAFLLIFAGFYYKISATEWMLSIIVLSLVLAVEAANTAIEKLSDFVHDEHHDKIGFVKDIAAGAVWFAAMAALCVEIIIFAPKMFGFLWK